MRRNSSMRAGLAAVGLAIFAGPAAANTWTLSEGDPPMLVFGLPGDGDQVLFSAMCPVGTGPFELSVHAAIETIPGITVAADGTRNSLDTAKVVFEVAGKSFSYDGAAVQPDDLDGGLEVDVQIPAGDPLMKALGAGGKLAVVLAGKPAGSLPLAGIDKPLSAFLKKCGG